MSFEIIDNSDDVKAAFEAAMWNALAKCGFTAEGYAKRRCFCDLSNCAEGGCNLGRLG